MYASLMGSPSGGNIANGLADGEAEGVKDFAPTRARTRGRLAARRASFGRALTEQLPGERLAVHCSRGGHRMRLGRAASDELLPPRRSAVD
jgi:hypothetical protein